MNKQDAEPGQKYDHGKRRWDLIPWSELGQVVDVLTDGARKYSPGNWKLVDNARARYFAATMRHLQAWFCGERCDPESGRSHLAHAGANVLFLLWFDSSPGEAEGSEND